jgi:hypothetical protein
MHQSPLNYRKNFMREFERQDFEKLWL